MHKKNKDKLAQLQPRKLRFRMAVPSGAVTGTGQPHPTSLQLDVYGASCNGASESLQEKCLPKRRGRGWTKVSAVFLATTVNVLVPKSIDRDRLIETRVQSESPGGTAHTHMKTVKLISERFALLNGGACTSGQFDQLERHTASFDHQQDDRFSGFVCR